MGEVIELRPRAAARSETAGVLAGLMEKEKAGELEGSIHITTTKEGTEFFVLGSCADRLQLGALALLKGLNHVVDKIVESGTAGHTHSNAVFTSWAPPRKILPRRLREATNFGELE